MIPGVLTENLEYFDITPELSERTSVYPGDTPFSRTITLDFAKGDNLVLSDLRGSAHIGAHTDGPNHYHRTGKGIGERSLHHYLGPAQVVSVHLPRGERIYPHHLSGLELRAPRVLFKTSSFPDPEQWNGDFNSLSPELIDFLAGQGAILVGIDTPSVDPADSKALETHNAIFKHDLAILEGIVLEKVPDGVYGLIALP